MIYINILHRYINIYLIKISILIYIKSLFKFNNYHSKVNNNLLILSRF